MYPRDLRAHMVQRSARLFLPTAFALLAFSQMGGGCSCEDDTGDKSDFATGNDPVLTVTPAVLTFASATVDRAETLAVTVQNTGTGKLSGFQFILEPQRGSFTIDPPDIRELAEGESVEVLVTYSPNDDIADTGELVVRANNQEGKVLLNSVTPERLLQCEPEIRFSGNTLNEPYVQAVKIRNIGNLAVNITGLGLEFGQDLAITQEPELSLELRPDDAADVEITYTPTTGGTLSDTLEIFTDGEEIFTCSILGSTTLPQISIAPPRVDFGNVATGETVTETVTITNVGGADLNLLGAEILSTSDEGFAIVNVPPSDTVLAPQESQTVDISYTAGTSTASGTAVFPSNDPTVPSVGVSIPLRGQPSQPDIGVDPTSINFGNVGQGVTSNRTISIFNNGTETLEITSMVIESASSEFAIGIDPSFPPTTNQPGSLEALGSVDVAILYSPENLGADQGTLVIVSNDPDTPELRIPLTANGLDRAECLVEVGPDPLNFGLVTRGSSTTLPLTVINRGSGPCTFNSATVQGTFNTAFTLDSTSLPPGNTFGPGEQMLVQVQYNPTAFDLNNGVATLNITDPTAGNAPVLCNAGLRCANGQGNPFECGFNPPPCGANLQGTAGVSDIAVIPGNVDFGLVTLGCASQNTLVTIYNTGAVPLEVSSISLENCGNEVELRAVPPLPQEIQASTPLQIQLVYRPGDLGEDQCTLLIVSDASESEPELRVPLRGEGTNISRQTDSFEQIDGRKVDVLFAIDASGSMSAEQDNVASNLNRFLQTAELLDNDFQIGVVHLDLQDTIRFNGTTYDAGVMIGTPPYLTRNTPNYLGEFQSRVDMGAGGGSQEAGLEAARIALSDPLITVEGSPCSSDAQCSDPYPFCGPTGECGGRNAGFLREDASLEIVIVSDEEDQSTATPEFYIDFFKSIKGFRNDSLLHVSVIVGADASGNPADCSSGGDDGAAAGRRYDVVAQATGGTTGSICASDFGTFLQNIGNRAFGLRREFFLSRAAEPATIEVRINGSPSLSGWSYDATTNSIIFDRNSVPAAGSNIDVEYEARCFQ